MSSLSQPPSPQEIDGNTCSVVTEDPELGTEGDPQSEQEQIIMRQGSDSSSSSSSTSSGGSAGREDVDVNRVGTLIGSTANLCSATLGAGM